MDEYLKLQIHKLGHDLTEIRCRAFENILTKIKCSLVSLDSLVESTDFIKNLIRYVCLDPVSNKSDAFKIILDVAEKKGANSIICLDPQLKELKKASEPDCIVIFSKIAALCYQSDYRADINSSESYHQTSESGESDNSYRELKWFKLYKVDLIESDLELISNLVKSLRDAQRLSHACRFLSTIVLHDFPPEVFIQHPATIDALVEIAECEGEKSKMAFLCFEELTKSFITQANVYKNIHLTPVFSNISGLQSMDLISDTNSQDSSINFYKMYSAKSLSKEDSMLSLVDFCRRILSLALKKGGQCKLIVMLADLVRIAGGGINALTSGLTHPDIFKSLASAMTNKCNSDGVNVVEMQIVVWKVLKNFIPLTKIAAYLERGILETIYRWLLDPVLDIVFPHILSYFTSVIQAAEFSPSTLHKEVLQVVASIRAGAQWVHSYQTIFELEKESLSTAVDLFASCIVGIEYHQQYTIIEQFIDFLLKRSDDMSHEDEEAITIAILRLLASSDVQIRRHTILTLGNVALTRLGPARVRLPHETSSNISHLVPVLLDSRIIVELVSFGLDSTDNEVAKGCGNILTAIVRSHSTLSGKEWSIVMKQLFVAMPYLIGSVALQDLSSDSPSRSLLASAVIDLLDPDLACQISLPRTSVIQFNIGLLFSQDVNARDEAISRLMYLFDINARPLNLVLPHDPVSASNNITGLYEGQSVLRVLEVLKDRRHLDNRVVKSSLTQLSIMTDDKLLHDLFIYNDGVEIIMKYLSPSSDGFQDNFSSCTAILRNIIKYNAKLRHEFSTDEKVLRSLIVGLFKVCCDWRSERDVSQLLALLAFSDCILINASGSVSLPKSIVSGIRSPFPLVTHEMTSNYSAISYSEDLMLDVRCRNLMAIHWAVSAAGGLDELVNVQTTDGASPVQPSSLALSKISLTKLKSAHPGRNLMMALEKLASSSSHKKAFESLNMIDRYLSICVESEIRIPNGLPWERTILRFVDTPPASTSDQKLLLALISLINRYFDVITDELNWLKELLQRPSTVLIYLLKQTSNDKCSSMKKELCIELLGVVERCICRDDNMSGWKSISHILMDALHDRHQQKFYSLGIVASILRCLASLRCEAYELVSSDLLDALISLLPAFHSACPSSYMGMNILRLTVLNINHILSSMDNSEIDKMISIDTTCLVRMIQSGDVILRASSLQLLSTLCSSKLSTGTILNANKDLWHDALNLVLEYREANLVKQQAAIFCSKFVCYETSNSQKYAKECIDRGLFRVISTIVDRVSYLTVLPVSLICRIQMPRSNAASSERSSSTSGSSEAVEAMSSPELLSSCLSLSINLLVSQPESVQCLKHQNLSNSLYRFVDKWCTEESINHSIQVEIYTKVCKLLSLCPSHCQQSALSKILTSLMWILQPSSFCISLNKEVSNLWTECLHLLAGLLIEYSQSKVPLTIESLETICKAVESHALPELQSAALSVVPLITAALNAKGSESLTNSLMAVWNRECVGVAASCKPDGGLTPAARLTRTALASLLAASHVATQTALKADLLTSLINRLKHVHISLAVMPPDVPRNKKCNKLLAILSLDLGVLTNALAGSKEAKQAAYMAGLADCLHKLWAWCLLDPSLLAAVLQLLITLSANHAPGAQSLVLTSTIAGVGQRKTAHSSSIMHAAMALLTNHVYSADVKRKVLQLVSHACLSQESRIVLSKSQIIKNYISFSKEKKSATKDEMEIPWLDFFIVFSSYSEGQSVLLKLDDMVETLLENLTSSKTLIVQKTLEVLRNLAFHPFNKQRIMNSERLLNWMRERLDADGAAASPEKKDIALIVSCLAANSQKAKQHLRSCGFLAMLELALISPRMNEDGETGQLIQSAISVLRRV